MNSQPPASYRNFHIILAILLAISLIAVVPSLNSDGREYYLQLRSIVLCGDASYWDEFQYHFEGGDLDFRVVDNLPSGYVPCRFPLGFAVLLTPFFLLGHLLGLLVHSISLGPPPNGYSFPEVLMTLMASAGLGLLGVWLSGMIAGRLYGMKAALWATLGMWLASPLPAYIYAQPSFAHSLSVLTSALVLLVWLQPKEDRVIRRAVAIGLSIGLAALVRWQDVVFLLLPVWDVIRYWRRWKLWRSVQYAAIIVIGILLGMLPQLVLWKIQFGKWITIPQGEGFMRWADPQLWSVLFGAQHGLISWTPVIAVAFLGMVWMAIRKPGAGVPLLILLVFQVYVNSVVLDWWAGWGFGGRRFLDMIPFFILASGFLFKEMPRWLRKVYPFVIGLLIIWNGSLLYHYFSGHVDFGGKVYFSTWCQENSKLFSQQPLLAITGIFTIAFALWLVHRKAQDGEVTSSSSPLRWMPATWMMVVAAVYVGLWALNLGRATLGMERLLVPNPKPLYREWAPFTYKPPFQGCGLKDTATREAPWHHLAPWTNVPGGEWKLATNCDRDLVPGDTAAMLRVEDIHGRLWSSPLTWGTTTGSSTVTYNDSIGIPVARLDLPARVKALPYRTLKPLPLYMAQWAQFAADYSEGRIPLQAVYEHSFELPDDLLPKRFEIQVCKAERCNIYGIGRVEGTK